MTKILCAIIAVTLSQLSFAAGDATAGQAKSTVCASCHGKEGISQIPSYPNLKGQNEEYLLIALKGYQSQERKGLNAATMYAMTGALSEQDMQDLAAYYANLK